MFISWLGWILGILLYGLGAAAAFYVLVWMPYKNNGQSFGKKQQKIKIMFVEDEEKWTLRPTQDGDLVQLLIRAIIGGIEATFIPILIAWYFITNDKKIILENNSHC